MNKIGVILKINIKSAILIMNNFWCKKLHPTDYIYVCLQALMLLERQNQRSLYEAKKNIQQKFIGIKHNGNKALRLLAA